ncbi:MAG: VapC toxin family PIN domain ribonuclease [Bacteroidetes bacterium QH_9_67_14]|nr:MAG: VapC toxin family PIN domain ribonuclease [Bacteroidetes bacterium QH_9_67_14]
MTYLIDSSIWLERMLEQERTGEVRDFLNRVPDHRLALTDFAFYSICLISLGADAKETLETFIQDTFVNGQVARLSIAPGNVSQVLTAMQRFGLDFDDGYQYVAAEQHDLDLVSFDEDFDDTERGRLTPEQVLQRLDENQQLDDEK